ncbi:DUF4136 domain-containing protein [Mongoliitalea daihaiensis]|uniref:DUF4136 domain-containing protein n=1 Tax=Mongoliitalea daihaiensis TaxID=2782006 RepID=UPI001F1BB952|nr:DUF4136 domain-containing protein [Mongoliitalea daihaiensis]UJP63834.1 DUF4136 domain-containing protein [Mongoliitalea daihaiensis]
MRQTYFIFAIAILILSCASQKDFVAEYDFNYSGNFKKYKTFNFVVNAIPEDSIAYFEAIERTITSRLGSQGFRLDQNRPDLLINYKVFNDSVKYRGYEQPNFDYWLNRRTGTVELTEEEELRQREKDETYNRVKFVEKNGLLVIYVIDNKKGNTIWQGYTAGTFDMYAADGQSDLTKATYRIMDQFRLVTRN